MSIFTLRWSRLRRELDSIVFLSVIHVWWSFNLPAYARLEEPYGTLVGTGVSIFGIILYAFIFSHPDVCVARLKFEQIDTQLCGHDFKNFIQVTLWSFFIASWIVVWYKDFYRMPSICYALLYGYYAVFFALLWRAAARQVQCTVDHSVQGECNEEKS